MRARARVCACVCGVCVCVCVCVCVHVCGVCRSGGWGKYACIHMHTTVFYLFLLLQLYLLKNNLYLIHSQRCELYIFPIKLHQDELEAIIPGQRVNELKNTKQSLHSKATGSRCDVRTPQLSPLCLADT